MAKLETAEAVVEPIHVAVNNGVVLQVMGMDAATADQFREYGFVEMMWRPGAILVDVTGMNPRPDPGWTYDGTSFHEPPAPEPEPTE